MRSELDARIDGLRSEMALMRSELEARIEEVRSSLDAKIEGVRSDLNGCSNAKFNFGFGLLRGLSLGPRRDRVAQSQQADHCVTGDRQRATGSARVCGSGAAPKPTRRPWLETPLPSRPDQFRPPRIDGTGAVRVVLYAGAVPRRVCREFAIRPVDPGRGPPKRAVPRMPAWSRAGPPKASTRFPCACCMRLFTIICIAGYPTALHRPSRRTSSQRQSTAGGQG